MTICLLVEFANRWWTFTYQALKYSYAFLDIMQDKDWFGVVSFDLKTEIVADFSPGQVPGARRFGPTAGSRF